MESNSLKSKIEINKFIAMAHEPRKVLLIQHAEKQKLIYTNN